jgi:hypothetical protein
MDAVRERRVSLGAEGSVEAYPTCVEATRRAVVRLKIHRLKAN